MKQPQNKNNPIILINKPSYSQKNLIKTKVYYTLPSQANSDVWIKFVRDSVGRGRSFLFGAKTQGKLVGFILASYIRDSPFEVAENIGAINDLYVLPEHRGKGMGEKLIIECLEKLKTEGVQSVRVQVLSENATAIGLYEKLGFKICRHGMIKTFI